MSTQHSTAFAQDATHDVTADRTVADFEALVRSVRTAGPADAPAPVEFATVFDLDYGERRLALVVPQQRTGSAPAPRVARPQPARSVRAASPPPLTCG